MAIEVPDVLVDKFVRDFEGLPGKGHRHLILELRESIFEVLDDVEEDPDILFEKEATVEFIRTLAMQEAMMRHGIYYDA